MLGTYLKPASAASLLIGVVGSPLTATAQDVNLDTRLETLAPIPPAPVAKQEYETVLVPKTTVIRIPPTTKPRPRSNGEVLLRLPRDLGGAAKASYMKNGKIDRLALCRLAEGKGISCERRIPVPARSKRITKDVPVKRAKPKSITLKANVASNYNYSSNAFSAPDARADMFRSVAPDLTLVIPVTKSDSFGVIGSYNGSRFDTFSILDRDIMLGSVSYFRDLGKGNNVGARFSIRASWLPGFSGEPTIQYIPSVEWNQGNIDLGGPTCGTAKDSPKCVLWKVGVSGAYTFFESRPDLENIGLSLSSGADWTLMVDKLVWRSTLKLTGKHFEDPRPDRDDFFIEATSKLDWTLREGATLSAGVIYSRLDSTVDAIEYEGYQVLPQVRLTIGLGEWPSGVE